jgi:hypothetical protein
MFAITVVLLNVLSFASLAYIANRKGHHTMAALAAAPAVKREAEEDWGDNRRGRGW